MIPKNIELTWEQYLHGQLADPDKDTLATRMQQDEALRNELMDDLELHSVMRQLGTGATEFMSGLRERLRVGNTPLSPALQDILDTNKDQAREPLSVARPAAGRRRPLRFFLAYAAAAALLIGIGTTWFVMQSGPSVRIAGTSGDVQERENAFKTGEKSACRLEFRDGSVVALGENTKAEIAFDEKTNAKLIRHDTGRMYLDVTKQDSPMIVQSGEFKVTVLGTRLLLDRSYVGSVRVLEGRALVLSGDSASVLRAGQTASMHNIAVHHRGQIRVAPAMRIVTAPAEDDTVAWLNALNVDGKQIAIDSRKQTRHLEKNNIDLDNYTVWKGRWTVDKDVIRQEDPKGGSIFLGTPRWINGQGFCSFRPIGAATERTELKIAFFYEHMTGLALRDIVPTFNQFVQPGRWGSFQGDFRIENKQLIVDNIEMRLEGSKDVYRTPRGVPMIKSTEITEFESDRKACGLGLSVLRGAMEFRDFGLRNATVAPGFSKPFKEKPLAVYSFKGGTGNRIMDLSGIGEPCDFVIGKPEHVQWLKDGLRVTGPADVGYSGSFQKLRDAWKSTKSFTMLVWARWSEEGIPDADFSRVLFKMKTARFHLDQQILMGNEKTMSWKTRLLAFTFEDKKKGFVTSASVDLRPRMVDFNQGNNLSLDTDRGPIELALAANLPKNKKLRLWEGDILSVEIYGRALSPEEVLQCLRAGPRYWVKPKPPE